MKGIGKNKARILTVGVILLIFSTMYLFISSKKIKNELMELKISSEQLEKNFEVLKSNYDLLKNENVLLKTENKDISEKSASLSVEMDKTISRLNNFETTVQDSIQWFKENNNIAASEKYGVIREEIGNCMNMEDTCRIDLTCIYEVNNKNKFKYTLDESSTGKEDFLKDLDTIYEDNGGDCEDFSLVFRAEYNYLLDQCLSNYSREDIVPVAEDKEIRGTYMYIICGSFDPKKIVENYGGHCLLGLTEKPINKTSDVYNNIKSSTLVEPQNGKFVAEMEDSDIIKVFDDGMIPDTLHRVWMVITEDDLKIFYEYSEEIGWVGYFDFLDEVNSLKAEVDK